MAAALYVEVNVIAASILFILILNKRSSGKNMLDEQLYQASLYVVLLYTASDTASWLLDGKQFQHIQFALYATNMLCFIFCIVLPYLWFLYAEFRLDEDEKKLKKQNRILAPILGTYMLLIITTPFTGWMFTINEKHIYQRGPLFLLQVFISLIFVIIPTVKAVLHLRKATEASERKECNSIGGFVIFPLIGLIVQVTIYGMPTQAISTVLAELVVFINIQNKQVSLDTLTGLNNRGQLNRYLNVMAKKDNDEKNVYMLLLDIDDFKSINDRFGHKVGDQALIDMSSVLQKVCGKQHAFLSRFGGDEFAIVVEKTENSQVDEIIENVEEEVKKFNESKNREYKLAISAGYAVLGTETVQTVDQLIEVADNRMYQMKEKRHLSQIQESQMF